MRLPAWSSRRAGIRPPVRRNPPCPIKGRTPSEGESRRLLEQLVYRHAPAGDSRLGFGQVAPPVDGATLGVRGAVHPDCLFRKQIDVPDDERAGGEVVGALLGHVALGRGTIVILTAHLSSKGWRTLEELHARAWHRIKG